MLRGMMNSEIKETARSIPLLREADVVVVGGKVFVDSSGDADLCVRAGAPFVMAGEGGEHEPMPMGLRVRLGGVDIGGMLDYVEGRPDELKSQYWMCLSRTKAEEYKVAAKPYSERT